MKRRAPSGARRFPIWWGDAALVAANEGLPQCETGRRLLMDTNRSMLKWGA